MAWNLGGLFSGMADKLISGMKDDKGLFQGGAEGVVGGRLKDLAMGLMGKSVMDRTRDLAKTFSPDDSKSVLKLQKMLNALGVTDSEGNELEEDAMFGNKTLSALRALQGLPYGEEETSFDYEPGKGPSGPIDPWAPVEGESTLRRNAPGNSTQENVARLFFNRGERYQK